MSRTTPTAAVTAIAVFLCMSATPARAQEGEAEAQVDDTLPPDGGAGDGMAAPVQEDPPPDISSPADPAADTVGPSQAEAGAESPPTEPLNHLNQVGIRAGFAVPYVFAVRYGEGPRCDADGAETFCRRVGAMLLDLELAFGVSEKVELGAGVRLGVSEDDAAATHPLGFTFGARAFSSPDAMFKLFFGGRIFMDITSSSTPDWSTIDIGMRGEFGLQVDFVRYLGMYLQLGETISFLRGLYFVTDGSVGLQFRFP